MARRHVGCGVWCILLFLGVVTVCAQGSFPARPIEFTIMAGTGGGADRYARFISALVDKFKFSPQPLLPVNKPGGAGAVAMSYVNVERAIHTRS